MGIKMYGGMGKDETVWWKRRRKSKSLPKDGREDVRGRLAKWKKR